MNVFKKILVGLLTIIMILCFSLFLISFNLKTTVTDMLTEGVVAEVLTSRVAKTFEDNIEGIETEDLQKVEDFVVSNKQIRQISDELINSTVAYLAEAENIDNFDITTTIADIIEDNKSIIEENIGVSISDSDIENIIADINEIIDVNEIYKEQVSKIKDDLSDEEELIIKTYHTLTTSMFRIIMLIVVGISLLLIALIKKSFHKWIPNLAGTLIGSGILVVIFNGLLEMFGNYIARETNINIKVTNIYLEIGLITLACGVVIIIIYQVIKKIIEKKQENNKKGEE